MFTSTGAIAISENTLDSGSASFDSVICTGTEQRLVDCTNHGYGCQPSEIAGVRCQPGTGMLKAIAVENLKC